MAIEFAANKLNKSVLEYKSVKKGKDKLIDELYVY